MPIMLDRFKSTNEILPPLLKLKRTESWGVLLQAQVDAVFDLGDHADLVLKKFFMYAGAFDDADK